MSDHSSSHPEWPTSWRRWQMEELQVENRQHEVAQPAVDTARQEHFRRQAELKALREKVMREAREEGFKAGFEQGRTDGHAQGLAEGRHEAEQELEQRTHEMLEPLKPLAKHFAEALTSLDEEVANEIVELALATGHQLAGEALKARPRQVLELVRALLHTDPPLTGQQRLWLHPLDHKLVEQHLGQELGAAGWTLQPDDQLSRGGCRVTSASGELDATWESRWQAVKAQVRRRRPSTPAAGDQE
ncbi:flagellar assembly protein FliH [Halomonas alkalisoli]|uniref:flagellar assembly protein FliH n=1 Tax=Halomonas alkalisoli TaxID=2907158 RepID=UPI001F37CE27|nr:flagellar assembly protein FliH [Halomonas alkalisoli]MCE9682799.1 flagellar assembly protein FliH [Halomonas alkalisoli]